MHGPQVSVYIAVSLDGFIAREDGGIDWLERVEDPGNDYGYQAFMQEVDCIVMGRNTYDMACGFEEWPFSGKQVTVLTHRPLDPIHGEIAHAGALRPLTARLAADGVRHIYLDGGVAIRQGLSEGVVDTLTLSWIPVLLGRGIPLFGGPIPESDWRLVRAQGYPKGLAQVVYQRA